MNKHILLLALLVANVHADTPPSVSAEWMRLQGAVYGGRSIEHMQNVRRDFFFGSGTTPPHLQATPEWLRRTYLQVLDHQIANPSRSSGRWPANVNGHRTAHLMEIARDLQHHGITGAAATRELNATRDAYARGVLRGFGLEETRGMSPHRALAQHVRRLQSAQVLDIPLVDRSSIQALQGTIDRARIPATIKEEARHMNRWMLRQPRMSVTGLHHWVREYNWRARDTRLVALQAVRHPGAPGHQLHRVARALSTVRAGPYCLAGTAVAAVAGLAVLANRAAPDSRGPLPASALPAGPQPPGIGPAPPPAATAANPPVAAAPGPGFDDPLASFDRLPVTAVPGGQP